jgi:hypothetical protein
MWHGTQEIIDTLETYQCSPYLRLYNTRKFAFRSTRYVFLGYSPLHKRVKYLDVSTVAFMFHVMLYLMRMSSLLPPCIPMLVVAFVLTFSCFQRIHLPAHLLLEMHKLMITCISLSYLLSPTMARIYHNMMHLMIVP